MARMVEQLLDFTRARVGGGFDLAPTGIDLGELCRRVIDELEVANPEWVLRLETSGELGGTWDADRLEQVISNLVANAGKHGRRGGEIRVRVDGSDADAVSIGIFNEGAIPAHLRPALFDPFRRARDGREQSGGLGLGLFITRELVEAHGGRVSVHSSDEQGTEITVRLPRHAAVRGRRAPLAAN
jgi:signal transduction histidine kinase